jgi:hypothetical protein
MPMMRGSCYDSDSEVQHRYINNELRNVCAALANSTTVVTYHVVPWYGTGRFLRCDGTQPQKGLYHDVPWYRNRLEI